jgi:outer membrane immunogenic protein
MMKFCTGILGLTLASVLAVSSAHAADIYQPPAPASFKDSPVYAASNWSGLYLGANGGYAWDAQSKHGGILDNGGFGGGQIGYNWQGVFTPHLVLGFEADIEGSGIDNSSSGQLTFTSPHVGGRGAPRTFTDPASHQIAIDYFGTVRGRVGLAAGQFLFYFTGGFAYGNVNNSFTDLATNVVFRTNAVQTGYVFGGGAEYKLNPAWSLKAEYQHINLGHENATAAGGGYVTTADTKLDTVRAGINYHFNTSYAPLK